MRAKASVIAQQGVRLASADNVAHNRAAGRLVWCFDQGFQPGSYHMLLDDGVLRRKPVRLFRNWLQEHIVQFRGSLGDHKPNG